jgi:hypothetical protein
MTYESEADIEQLKELFAPKAAKPEEKFACPFTYASGKRCKGHIVRVEAYKADISWTEGENGKWSFDWSRPRSHFHIFCSEKDNHAGLRGDSEQMKFYLDKLPDGLAKIVFDRRGGDND